MPHPGFATLPRYTAFAFLASAAALTAHEADVRDFGATADNKSL